MTRGYTWFCIACKKPTELNRHGYCAHCGSPDVYDYIHQHWPDATGENIPYAGEVREA